MATYNNDYKLHSIAFSSIDNIIPTYSSKKMFGKINQIPVDNDKKIEVIKYSILAFEKLRYSNKLNKIEKIDVQSFELMKDVFLGIDELEATMYYQIIKERVEIIRKFQQVTDPLPFF